MKILGGRSFGKSSSVKNGMIERIIELQKIGFERKLFWEIAEIEELQKLGIKDLNYVLSITEQVVGKENEQ